MVCCKTTLKQSSGSGWQQSKEIQEHSQSNLGTMHGQGKGVRQGYVEVVKWFRLAADHANARYNLGNMYYEGRGIWHKTMSKQ